MKCRNLLGTVERNVLASGLISVSNSVLDNEDPIGLQSVAYFQTKPIFNVLFEPMVQYDLTPTRHLPGSDGCEFKTWLTTETVEEASLSLDSIASMINITVLRRLE